MCRHEITVTQEEIIAIAAKKLKHGGRFCICQRTERFTDLIVTLRENGLEPKRIQMVTGTVGGAPYLVLIEAVKGIRPALKILPDFVNGV